MPEPTPLFPFTADSIVDTVREPLLVLDAGLRVRRANRSFYQTFRVEPADTEARLLYELGNGQWDIPALRRLLEEILPQNAAFDDFEVTHDFEAIGRKVMLLNARRVYREGNRTESILLAIEDITERRRTEEALAAQQEWLRVTLGSIGDAVIATDAEGRVTFLNPSAEALTGWTDLDAKGLPLERIFPIVNEETRRTVENPVTKALREGAVVGLANHTLLIRKDGTETPIDDSAAPIRDVAGQGIGVVLVFRDVTERRKAERMAQEAREYAESIVATVREALLVLDDDLRVRSANASFYRTFRVTPAETEGCLLYDLGNRQWDIPALRTLLEEILPQQSSFNDFEVTHDFEAIGRKVMLLNARRLRRGPADPGLILLAVEDVTERRRAEEERRELETRFTSLVKNIKDHSIFTLDPEGRITSWNREAERILGYGEAEALGQHFSIIFSPEDRQAGVPADELHTALSEGRAEDERWHVRKGGEQFWALGIVTPTRDAAGQHTGFSKILRDMTDRKRLEEELHRRVQQLQEADRHKDEFLAMLGHELRNPLAPLRSLAEVLQRQRLDGPALERAHAMMARQVEHLTRLVDDLLDVSRLTRGKVELRKEVVDLAGVVDRAVEMASPLVEGRGHELMVSLPRRTLRVEGDLTRLTQVVFNLLSNAVKYTEAQGRIWLTAEREGGQAVLRVRDNGSGMSAELLPRVFDLFTQGERKPDRSQGGLGLGLALVKRLVEMHGGTVEAHSAGLGQGSAFVVRLPALPAEPPAPAAPGAPPRLSAAPAAVQVDRVLVVDDNPDVAESLVMLLEGLARDIRTAGNGPQALALARAFRPEVILCDIGLPGMDGCELARRLRQEPGLGEVLLAAVSGYGQEEDHRRSQEAGFDRHLVKPIGRKALEELLAEVSRKAAPPGPSQ